MPIGERASLTVGAAAVVAAVIVTYANALGASFQFDDWNVIVRDARVQSLAAWWQSMPGIRPLLKLSYAANHASGLGAVGFHAVNVAIHAANAVLAWLLLGRLSPREGVPPSTSRLAALIGALVFALHPVQTEAMNYMSGRSTSIAAFFALASVLATVEGLERARRALLWGLAPALFACALAVKEFAIVVPGVVVLWIATDTRTPLRTRHVARALPGHAVVVGLALAALALSPTYRSLLARSLEIRGPIENLLVQVHGLSYLVGQLVRVDRLNADPTIATSVQWSPMFTLKAVGLVAALSVGVGTIRSRPSMAFGVLWMALWLAPTNSLVARLDVSNDRQLYVALMGPAWLAARWIASLPLRRGGVIAIAVLVSCALGAATAHRNTVYADEVRFWEDVVRKSQGNTRALNNLGYAYALACRSDEAEAAFLIARDLAPDDVQVAANLSLLREGALLPPGQRRCAGP